MIRVVRKYRKNERRRKNEHDIYGISQLRCGEGQAEEDNQNDTQNHQNDKAQEDDLPGRKPRDVAQNEVVADSQEYDGACRRRDKIRAGIKDTADTRGNERVINARGTEKHAGSNRNDDG